MNERKRKPVHPGIILDEHYIKPLNLNLQELSDYLDISRNTLFKIRIGQASVTPGLAMKLAAAFDTTPNLWLNLQQKYDIWMEANKPSRIMKPLYRSSMMRIHRKKTSRPLIHQHHL